MSEVKFCGQYVGSGKRRIDPSKIEAIKLLKRPETKAQVRSIIGTFSWFRDYIPNFSEHIRPLVELTGKRIANRIPWGQQQQQAFDELKELLCKAVDCDLHVIDWTKSFNIFQMPATMLLLE